LLSEVQLNLKLTETENYVNIFIHSAVQWSQEMEDGMKLSSKMLKIVSWRHNRSRNQTSLCLSLPIRLPVGDLGSILQLFKVFIFQVLMKSTEKTPTPVEENVFPRKYEQT